MEYINKQDILNAYQVLSKMSIDPTLQGATQKVSAIRYLLSLDMYCHKTNKTECSSRDRTDKNLFSNYVGVVCAVSEGLYTTNFYYPLKDHNGDYNVGSNFYSAGQVKASLVNPANLFDYPKRGNMPLFHIRNGVMIRDFELYENIDAYLETDRIKAALVVWIARGYDILGGDSVYKRLFDTLRQYFSSEMVVCLMPNSEEFHREVEQMINTFSPYPAQLTDKEIEEICKLSISLSSISYNIPIQVIYYGAPGTGKSHKIKGLNKRKGTKTIRTTFHPDSDYATFVGAYKPTMEVVPRYESSGTQVEEKRIVYNFVPQAFLKAYVQAWAHYPEPQYLVIEEINRGNCAQIFGDLFQLLDRSAEGFSEYPIVADSDISKYLCETFATEDGFAPDESAQAEINELYKEEYENVMADVQAGELLLLPKNLHILATMNTSDQSLFPIDSAFKRRWEWEYIPIRNAGKGWVIKADKKEWDWWTFLERINAKIGSVTDSEDKKLGYFFVKPQDDHSISAETFVSKVIFYLWNDVFKDYGFSDKEFQTAEGTEMTFPMFYETDVDGQRVNEPLVAQFLQNVVGEPLQCNLEEEATAEKTET